MVEALVLAEILHELDARVHVDGTLHVKSLKLCTQVVVGKVQVKECLAHVVKVAGVGFAIFQDCLQLSWLELPANCTALWNLTYGFEAAKHGLGVQPFSIAAKDTKVLEEGLQLKQRFTCFATADDR